jgi:hypothetical protein
VIQVSGGPGEDGDFSYGDGTAPYRSPAGLATILGAHGESFQIKSDDMSKILAIIPFTYVLGGPII